MGRKHGFSFSWRRATGYSAAKGRLSRKIGIPLTRSGRQRKIGRAVGCLLPLLALLLFVLILGFSVSAQEPSKSKADLKAKIKSFRNSDKFSVQYDRFKDETHIGLSPFFVKVRKTKGVARLAMSADVLFPGTIPKTHVSYVSLTFRVYGQRWRFLYDKSLYALINGERKDLGEGSHYGELTNFGGVTETLTFMIPTDTFETIAKSRPVDFQAGGCELSLEEEHTQAFSDLLSLTEAKH